MNKKNYLWWAIGLVVLILAVYVLASLTTPATENGADDTNVPAGPNVDSAATENKATSNGAKKTDSSDATTLPVGVTPIPNPASDPSFSKETLIKVDADGFSPKAITVKAGTKAFLTFSASDDKRHTFAFTDPSLDFILVVFNKAEGDKSITFPAPQAGSYTFYIDDKANTGTLTVK